MSTKTEAQPVDDGRNFAADLAMSIGEAAQMRVDRPSAAYPATPIHGAITPSPGADPTYYDQPVVKEPVWIATIPTYFFVGGLSGAVSVLAMVARGPRLSGLRRASHLLATIADTLSAGLLIADLGRPSRFLNMLRVFRPTSPMSIGSWVLAWSGASSFGALVLEERSGVLGALGRGASSAAGLLGGPLAGYTAVLLTNSAIPAWCGARRTLPLLFIASSAASAGAVLALLPLDAPSRRIARRFGTMGKIAELAASFAVERELSSNPRARDTLRHGVAGALWRAARVATAASLATSLLSRRSSRTLGRVSDGLAIAGALALRFAVFHAGKASARDPRATFHAQQAQREVAA